MAYRVLIIGVLFLLSFNVAAAYGQSEFGAWYPEPGAGSQPAQVYDSSIEPFNDSGVAEQTTFACVSPDGSVLTAEESSLLGQVVLAASSVYDGDFSFGGATIFADNDKQRKDKPPENGGYPSGSAGMKAFIRNEIILLENGKWIDYDSRSLKKGAAPGKYVYTTTVPGWSVELDKNAEPIDASQGQNMAALLDADANHPLQLTSDLPEACALSPLEPSSPSFGDLFSSPGDFVLNTFLYGPAKLASAGFDFFQPYAFRYTFFTPHTERGDLMWSIPATCVPGSPENKAFDSSQIASACQGQTPLGYTEPHSSSGQDRAWFLQAAVFLQWLISATYFLILFTAAVLYMVRGNRHTQLNVIQLIPRLILSVVLTVFAGFLIGALITISNLLVQSIFDINSVESVGAINTLMLQSGNIIGGPEILQQAMSLFIGVATVFFFFVFVIASLARQVLLVILVVLAPLAAFSLLNNRWHSHFRLYLRVLMAIVLLPVVMALILKVGMSINPLVTNPGSVYGQIEGTAGLLLMIVTLWLMYKAIKLSKDFVITGSTNINDYWDSEKSLIGQLRPALASAGGNSVTNSPQSERAQIVPQHKETSMGSGGKMISKPVTSQDTQPRLNPAPPSAEGQSGLRAPDAQGFDSFKQARQEIGKRISAGAAKRYREGLRKAIAASTAAKGRKLKPEEVADLKKRYARKHGGRLTQQGNSWYLAPVEPAGFEGESSEDESSAD